MEVVMLQPPAKKRRLDHLSWEEKLLRKKLKNRVAAQTSRDRKKAKMDDMEGRVSLLEKTNSELVDAMKSLKELNQRLLNENKQLKRQAASVNAVTSVESSGSAVSRPLPKEGSTLKDLRAMPIELLYRLVMAFVVSKISSPSSNPKSTSIASNSLPTHYSEKLMQKLLQIQSTVGPLEEDAVHHKWWGPQQNTWNPVEVKA